MQISNLTQLVIQSANVLCLLSWLFAFLVHLKYQRNGVPRPQFGDSFESYNYLPAS